MCAHLQGIAIQSGHQSGQGLIFDELAALPRAANFFLAHARHSSLGSDYSGISTRRSLPFSRCGYLRVGVVRFARETVATKYKRIQITGNQIYLALGLLEIALKAIAFERSYVTWRASDFQPNDKQSYWSR